MNFSPAQSRWALLRAWAEKVPFDFADASTLAGLTEPAIRAKAAKEGWIVERGHRGIRPVVELERMRQRLWARLDAATDRPTGEALGKAEVDSVQVLMKALDRLEAAANASEDGEGEANLQPAGYGEALAAINGRIVELSRQIAAQMVAEGGAGEADGDAARSERNDERQRRGGAR